MDSNKRFDQLESLLVDLARKQDQQAAQIAQVIEELNRQGEAIGELSQAFTRQEKLLTIISEQVDGVTGFLKISATRHEETERQQAEMLLEMQRLGKRTDASVEAIKLLLKRQEATDTRLDGIVQSQLQMLQLQRLDADKLDDLSRRLPTVEGQEPRIKRLEDELSRSAS